MMKLYVLYLLFGGFMLINSWFIGSFREFNGGDNMVTIVAYFSSAILFLAGPGLTLYRLRWASILGLLALITVFPFGIHWLIYRYQFEGPLTQGGVNQAVLVAAVLYVISVGYAVKYTINPKTTVVPLILKAPVKWSLAFLPIFLFLVFQLFK